MIRKRVFKQLELTKFTYSHVVLERMGWDNQMRLLKQLSKFTYRLETDKEGRIENSEKKYSNDLN